MDARRWGVLLLSMATGATAVLLVLNREPAAPAASASAVQPATPVPLAAPSPSIAAAPPEDDQDSAAAHDALATRWRSQSDLRSAVGEHQKAIARFGALQTPQAAAAHASYAVTLLAIGEPRAAHQRAKLALEIFDHVPQGEPVDRCAALWALAESAARLKKAGAITEARAALDCLAVPTGREDDVARASLTLASLLSRSPEKLRLLKVAAANPSVQMVALDALAALRPYDSEAGCAAAIEALVRERSDRREKAARGCKLPRRH